MATPLPVRLARTRRAVTLAWRGQIRLRQVIFVLRTGAASVARVGGGMCFTDVVLEEMYLGGTVAPKPAERP